MTFQQEKMIWEKEGYTVIQREAGSQLVWVAVLGQQVYRLDNQEEGNV